MAFIRKYGNFPALFVPDEGELVLASRSAAKPFRLAVITKVRRAAHNKIRVDFVWMEGAQQGVKGNVYVSTEDTVPLIRRVPKGYRARQTPPPDGGGA